MATAPKIPVDLHPSGVAYVYTAEAMDERIAKSGGIKGDPGPRGLPGYTPIKGLDYFDGATGSTGPAGSVADVDGGEADSIYGGADPIDAGEI